MRVWLGLNGGVSGWCVFQAICLHFRAPAMWLLRRRRRLLQSRRTPRSAQQSRSVYRHAYECHKMCMACRHSTSILDFAVQLSFCFVKLSWALLPPVLGVVA